MEKRDAIIEYSVFGVTNADPWLPEMFGIGPNDFGYIPRVLVPKLQAATGLSDAEVRTILVDNPQRFLARF